MASLIFQDTKLKNLLYQARRLTSTALSLISLFDEEAIMLNRRDEASRLKALYSSIRQQLHEVRRSEDAAEYGHARVDMISSLGGLAVSGIVKSVSKNKRLSEFADYVFESPLAKEPPFGTVLICIGSKGLPDDVGIVSISRSARESNRKETEVINELREHGYLLLREKDFSSLIDKLINDIHEGRQRLPVSMKELSEIKVSGTSDLEYDHSE
jgi:hypothetical protein